jgi:hydrogenase maturation protein HypF
MSELNFPVVATSGNISDEPICTDEHEAIRKLSGIADLFLVHNRPIAHYVDDSVARIIMNRKQLLRAGRGYAPLSIELRKQTQPTLAAGGQLKNTVAISNGQEIFLSPYIGNLGSFETVSTFEKVIADFKTLYDFRPRFIVCDSHPDYYSTRYAEKQNAPVLRVQHHYAHVLACMEEHKLEAPALGVSWDGTGYGPDGTVWGGEFLKITEHSFDRVGHFRYFPLPGGEKAIKEPRRTALGLLHEIFEGAVLDIDNLAPLKSISPVEINILISMIQKKLNTPLTSSVGRLFDAVSSILGLCQYNTFEGKAAMKLEFVMDNLKTDENYDYTIINSENQISSYTIDWAPTIKSILDDLNFKTPVKSISAKFHNTLVEIIISMARHVGEEKVVLTGGCFQNKYLLERAIDRLNSEGFSTYWPERIPPNDGGIALGQIVAASRILNGGLENVPSSSWKDT